MKYHLPLRVCEVWHEMIIYQRGKLSQDDAMRKQWVFLEVKRTSRICVTQLVTNMVQIQIVMNKYI